MQGKCTGGAREVDGRSTGGPREVDGCGLTWNLSLQQFQELEKMGSLLTANNP